jgi:hypothetical protein
MTEVTTDIYIRSDRHANYSPDLIINDTPLDIIVAKLEMIMYTRKGEVLGDVDFGADLEFYLYKTQVDARFVEDVLREQINTYITELNTLPYQLQVTFIQTPELSDALLVKVFLYEAEISALFFDPSKKNTTIK